MWTQKKERILALLCPWADYSGLLRLLPAVIKAMMQNYIESMIVPNYPVQPNAKAMIDFLASILMLVPNKDLE